MSNNGPSGQDQHDDMAPECDFSRGVRGKHAKAMRDGYTMVIHKSDGSTEVREVAPRPGTVVLDQMYVRISPIRKPSIAR